MGVVVAAVVVVVVHVVVGDGGGGGSAAAPQVQIRLFDNGGVYESKYSLSNVILADEKLTSLHQNLGYCYKCGIIVFSIPGAIL